MKSTPDAEIIGKLAEISENVDRGNLTPARRRELIRQYVKLLSEHDEMLKEISAHDAPKLKSETNPNGAGRKKSPTADAAEKFGVDRATVKRALAEAKSEPAKPPEPISQARPCKRHSSPPLSATGNLSMR